MTLPLAYSRKCTLLFGGQDLGTFTRGDLVNIHAFLDAHLEIGSDTAAAWLTMTPEDRARVLAVIEAVSEYFCSEAGMELNGRARRIAAGLMSEFAPGATDEGIAAALRNKPAQVAANRRWLKSVEKDDRWARVLAILRQWIRAKLEQPGAPRQAAISR